MKNRNNNARILFASAALALCGVCPCSFAQDDYESAVLGRGSASAELLSTTNDGVSGFMGPSSADLNAQQVVNGRIVVRNAKVELPQGEGYEAVISANGQGLLDELRLYEDDYDLVAELGVLSKQIAGEIAQEQAQVKGTEQKESEKAVDPAQAKLEAEAAVAEQFELLNRFGDNGPQSDSDRPQITRGMHVKKGQYLGKLQDDELKQEFIVALQELLVARKEAEKTLEVDVAIAAARVAQASYRRADSMNKSMPGSISPEEVDEKYYDWIRAAKSIEKARYDLEVNREKVKVSLARVNATKVQIRNRKLRSPIDGYIDEIYQNEGQWVREGDKILRILRLDKVQVTGTIDANQFSPEDVDGKAVVVKVNRPGYEPIELQGKVVYVRQIVESGHYYFYADVENKTIEVEQPGKNYWLLNPGSLVTVEIVVE